MARTHTAGAVAKIAAAIGVPLDPPRIRSWHSREGLVLGEEDSRWRYYSDPEALALVMIRVLSVHGIPAGELALVMPTTRDALEEALHSAERGDAKSASDLFVVALRREGKQMLLMTGERSAVMDRAAQMPGAACLPLTFLNLSELARGVLAAMRQSQE